MFLKIVFSTQSLFKDEYLFTIDILVLLLFIVV